MKEAVCIGVGGDSASGKSTMLGLIKLLLNEKLIDLEGDGDHKWERGDDNWNVFSHLNPKGNFLYKQASDIAK
jgi:uridine kinase